MPHRYPLTVEGSQILPHRLLFHLFLGPIDGAAFDPLIATGIRLNPVEDDS